MRSEDEMFDLIINTANEDVRIRAAYLCGSRVNPDAPKDIFRDYDVAYVVTETGSFMRDKSWINRFGNRLYMQYPEDSVYYPSDNENCYGWLMQFDDGVRLDLHVNTLRHALSELKADPLYKILMDKDGCLPEPPAGAGTHYWVKRPTEAEFRCTCNEFWWCLNNAEKGLWREELPYAMDMLNMYLRPMLVRLLGWKAGVENNFAISVGKLGKYLKRWLKPRIWERFLNTYPRAATEDIWVSAIEMCDLVDEAAVQIAAALGFVYDAEEARQSRAYFQHVRFLPKDVSEVY